MIKDEYSPYKIVHNMELIRKIKNKENFYPQQVHFVPMNVCNHNCSFCAYRMDGYSSSQKFNDRDWIKEEKCIEILTDLKNGGTKAIQFTGGGEPTVHPKINNIFRHTLDLGLELALVTNGMKMNDETIELLSRAQWVRFSLDSFNDNTYSAIRKVSPDKMFIVKENIRKLIFSKSKDTVVGVGFVVTKENYKEVYECAKMCKEMGVDNFRISASFTPLKEKYFDDFLQKGKIQISYLGDMRSRSISNSVILCNESQNLNTDLVKMVITRVGENSQLIMDFDLSQIDHKNFEKDNGMLSMLECLQGEELFGCVELDRIERSAVARLAELIK